MTRRLWLQRDSGSWVAIVAEVTQLEVARAGFFDPATGEAEEPHGPSYSIDGAWIDSYTGARLELDRRKRRATARSLSDAEWERLHEALA